MRTWRALTTAAITGILLIALDKAACAAEQTVPARSLWPLPVAVIVSAAGMIGVHYAMKQKVNATFGASEVKINAASYRIAAVTALFALFGIAVGFVAAFGSSDGSNADVLRLLGMNLLAASSAGSVGALAGFIFGIPRTLDPAARAAVAGAASNGGTADKTNAILASNTNLERISDWLTTLLVGATLVQMGSIIPGIKSFAAYLTTDAGKAQGPIVLLLLYFFTLGFLGIYLITRLYLTSALTQTLGSLGVGAGLTNIDALKAALTNGSSVSDDAVPGYFALMKSWPLSAEETKDAELNYLQSLLLYRYLTVSKAGDQSDTVNLLRVSAARSIVDPVQRVRLKTFLEAEVGKTGSQSVAGDILNSLFRGEP